MIELKNSTLFVHLKCYFKRTIQTAPKWIDVAENTIAMTMSDIVMAIASIFLQAHLYQLPHIPHK